MVEETPQVEKMRADENTSGYLLVFMMLYMILLVFSIILTIVVSVLKSPIKKRIHLFTCTTLGLCYLFGLCAPKEYNPKKRSKQDDDSDYEVLCWNLNQSIASKKPRTILSVEHAKTENRMPGDKKSRGRKPATLYNFKRKDNIVKVRLEFLCDLAAYMTNQCPDVIGMEQCHERVVETPTKRMKSPSKKKQKKDNARYPGT